MASPTNVRFPDQVDHELASYARRSGSRKSTVVVGAVREWLAMQNHPGILFVTTLTGERQAALMAGPAVWQVAEAWQQHEGAARAVPDVADAVGLTGVEVEAALGYWADNRDEIDGLIARHQHDQDEALAAWERRQSLDAV